MAEREYLVEQEYFNLDKTESITIKIPKDTIKINCLMRMTVLSS